MFKKSFFTTLLLLGSAAAQADVSVFSVLPGDFKVTYGAREASLSPMQGLSLSNSDPLLELSIVDDKGVKVLQRSVANNRHWVLGPGKDGQPVLTEAGYLSDQGKSPLKAVSFFNATGYSVIVDMFAKKGEDSLTDVKIGKNEAAGPYELGPGSFKMFVKDEGGNPIGECYSFVNAGNFYLIYRKRPILYDLESLGTILPNK
jgi:hypothetical protein